MKQSILQTFKIGLATFMAIVLSGVVPTGVALAVTENGNSPGNNGTVKVGDLEIDNGNANVPHVGCTFEIKWFGFDTGIQETKVEFEKQGNVGDYTLESIDGETEFSFEGSGLGNNLDAAKVYVLNFSGEPHDQQGYHVKLTVSTTGSQGSDTKSKVFWVEGCDDDTTDPTPLAPRATVTVMPCDAESGNTDVVDVRVYNTDDETNAVVTYKVTIGNQEKTIANLADGANTNTQFGGLAAGTYTAHVSGDDGTQYTTGEFVVNECPVTPVQLAPTATATIVPCTLESGLTDKVSVRVYNTDDATNAEVTYTITLNGEVKTVIVPDGQDRNVEYGGLPVGTYTATVVGSDGTVTTNAVTVEMCEVTPVQLAPTATATIVPCTLESGLTDKVSVRVYNTDDATDATVTYTITLNGVVKTVTVDDGENKNVEYNNLPVGTYTATVVGSDGTVTTNAVTVEVCEEGDVLGETDVCENIGGTQTEVPAGYVRDAAGVCLLASTGSGGDVLGVTTADVLADTGESSNPIINMIIGLGMLGLTFSVAILSRRQNA